jgi:hypothetical protein
MSTAKESNFGVNDMEGILEPKVVEKSVPGRCGGRARCLLVQTNRNLRLELDCVTLSAGAPREM